MNVGAQASSGEVLLFLHADVRLGPGGLAAVRDNLRNPEVAGGNFDIHYEGCDWVAAAFTSVNRWRRRLGVFYGDSGISVAARSLRPSVDTRPGQSLRITTSHGGSEKRGS